jgi:hypothetical protein
LNKGCRQPIQLLPDHIGAQLRQVRSEIVKTDKLAKQLKKELSRNPKKTATLAIISIVAVWMWGPLAWKWIAGDESKTSSQQVAAKSEATAKTTSRTPVPTPDEAASAKKKLPKFTWKELLSKIDRDDRMQPATLAALPRDPFTMSAAEQKLVDALPSDETNIASTVPRVTPAEPTPESLGLKLEGTLITGQRRRATISGEAGEEGKRIKFKVAPAGAVPPGVLNADGMLEVEFLLELVEPRRVVIVRNDKQYELTLVRATLSGDDELVFGSLQEE